MSPVPEQPRGWCPTSPEQYGALVHGTNEQQPETTYTPEKIERIEQEAAAAAGVDYPTTLTHQLGFKLRMFLDKQD